MINSMLLFILHVHKHHVHSKEIIILIMLLYLDTYDAAAIAGGMGEGHIPCGALYEMIRIVKPGNFWITCFL